MRSRAWSDTQTHVFRVSLQPEICRTNMASSRTTCASMLIETIQEAGSDTSYFAGPLRARKCSTHTLRLMAEIGHAPLILR
jgi:hypothetical protein